MKRLLGAIAACAVTSAATAAGCAADPFREREVDITADGSLAEGGGSDGSTGDSAPDSASFDAAVPDAPIVSDAGAKVDASGCTTCDCDSDGYSDLTKTGCADAGGVQDCDDTDSRSRPSQGFLVELGEPPRQGDWNCNGAVEKFYPPNTSCTALSPGAPCDATFGFKDNPACGATGMFVTCKSTGSPPLYVGGGCVVATQNTTTKQACK